MGLVRLPGDENDVLYTDSAIQAQLNIQSNTGFKLQGAYNARLQLKTATASSAALSGASGSVSGLIPAGCLLLGVLARVTTLLVGPTQWLLGYAGDTNAWGNNLAVALGTATTFADFTSGTPSPLYFAAATDVVITKVTTDFTAGVVRLVSFYYDVNGIEG